MVSDTVARWKCCPSIIGNPIQRVAKSAPKMAVGKESHISLEGTEMSDHPIGAVRNFGRHFTTRTSVTEQVPIRSRSANLHRTLAFIFTVVPLGQVRLYFSRVNQRNQGASLPARCCRGQQNTRAKVIARRRSPSSRASCWPRSVNGRSVRLVCRPDRYASGFAVSNKI